MKRNGLHTHPETIRLDPIVPTRWLWLAWAAIIFVMVIGGSLGAATLDEKLPEEVATAIDGLLD